MYNNDYTRYSRRRDTFNPDNITKEDMIKVANHIEEYIIVLEEIMIIPEEILEEHGDRIYKAIKVVKKLIKKLKKGDRSIFKDEEDLENLI